MVEVQYTRYDVGGHFKKHQDVVGNGKDYKVRCLTLSMNITDESKYEGGELILFNGNEKIFLPKKSGSFVIFPSFVHHQANSVLSGTRHVIVAWLSSSLPQFKQFLKCAKNI